MKKRLKGLISILFALVICMTAILPAVAADFDLIVYYGTEHIKDMTVMYDSDLILDENYKIISISDSSYKLDEKANLAVSSDITGWNIWGAYQISGGFESLQLLETIASDGMIQTDPTAVGQLIAEPIFETGQTVEDSNAYFLPLLLLMRKMRYFDGDELVMSVCVNGGEILEPLNLEDKDGMTLEGWYTDKALTEKFDFSQPIKSGRKLYAKWIEAPAVEETVEPEETTEAAES